MTGTSGRRVDKLAVGDLTPAQRQVYDVILGGPRASGSQAFRIQDDSGGLEGPFNAFLLQPAVGLVLQEVGSAIRYQGELSARAREIAILIVSAEWDSAFERHAHEAVGRSVGLSDGEIEALRVRDFARLENDHEQLLARSTQQLLTDGDLADTEYEAFVEVFDISTLFELTSLVGYYATLALQLRVFRVPAPGTSEEAS